MLGNEERLIAEILGLARDRARISGLRREKYQYADFHGCTSRLSLTVRSGKSADYTDFADFAKEPSSYSDETKNDVGLIEPLRVHSRSRWDDVVGAASSNTIRS